MDSIIIQALPLLPKPSQSKFLHLGSVSRVHHPINSQSKLLTDSGLLDDIFFPDSLRDKCEATFSEREDSVDYEFIMYQTLVQRSAMTMKFKLLLNSSLLFFI